MLIDFEALYYDEVNKSESAEDLKKAVEFIAGKKRKLKGRRRTYDSRVVQEYIDKVIEGKEPPNTLTRKYGIRQQAMYIKYYKDMEAL